jgi:hypothetical protein
MGPTSRLLTAEMMVPERTEIGGDLGIYRLDFVLMLINVKEKSKKEFEEIVDAAGLENVKIWKAEVGTQVQIGYRLKGV